MEKKFEKLNMDILMDVDSSVIPEIESFEDLNKSITNKVSNINDVDTDEVNEFEGLKEVNSISDLEEDPNENDDNDPSNPVGNTSTENNDSENIGLAKFLSAKGYLEYEESEFEDSDEWIESKVEDTLTKRAEDALDPNIKYINDLYKKGVSLRTLIEKQVADERLDNIEDSDIRDDERIAESVVREYLGTVLDQDSEDVDETISTYKDAGILTKEALKYKPKLKTYYDRAVFAEAKQAEYEALQKEREVNERISVLKKVVDSTPEFIKGVPIASTEKEKLFVGITKKDRQGLTEYQKKLMDPEMQLKVAQFILLLDGDISKLATKVKTQVVSNIKKQTNSYKEKSAPDVRRDAAKALDFLKQYNRKNS